MENLVRAGAFDGLHGNRRELLQNMDLLLAHADSLRREAESSQDNLFGGGGDAGAADDGEGIPFHFCSTAA